MATYLVSASTATVNEGSTVTFTISVSDSASSTYYWTITGTNITTGDFSDSLLQGTISNGALAFSETVSKTITSDVTNESVEEFILQLRLTAYDGEIVAISPHVQIVDTSDGITPDLIQGTIRMVESEGFVYRSSGTWYAVPGTPISL